MMVAGSFHGTRTTGTVSVCEIACSIGQTSFISVVPCCMSMHRVSKPCRAMTSAVNPWEIESQPIVTYCPARHICLILFGRTVAPLVVVMAKRSPPDAYDASRGLAGPAILPIHERSEYRKSTQPLHWLPRWSSLAWSHGIAYTLHGRNVSLVPTASFSPGDRPWPRHPHSDAIPRFPMSR